MMVGHLPPTAVAALRALEQRLVRRSDLVITVGNRLAGHYRRMGAKKAIVVGNWKSPVEFQFSAEDIVRARRELGLDNGAIAICFVANLGRERHLESLLAAVAADQRFACVIGGDGPQTQLVQRAAGKHDNIVYLGRINPRRIPVISAACDVVYYGFDRSNPNAPWSAPNKLFEAIAAGKPVLCGDFGEIGDIVRSSRCGVIADTSTASGVSTGLEKLADRAGLAEMGRRAEALQKKFSRRAADNRLANAYQSLLSAGPTTRRAGRASCRRRPCKLASCGGAPMAHDAEDGSC